MLPLALGCSGLNLLPPARPPILSEWVDMLPKRLFDTCLRAANRLGRRFQQMQRQPPSPNPQPQRGLSNVSLCISFEIVLYDIVLRDTM